MIGTLLIEGIGVESRGFKFDSFLEKMQVSINWLIVGIRDRFLSRFFFCVHR